MKKFSTPLLVAAVALLVIGIGKITGIIGGDATLPGFTGSRHDPVHDALNTTAIGLRPSLPERIDEITELVDVSVAGDTLTYRMKLDDALPQDSVEKIKANIQAVHQRHACADPGMSAVIKAGGTLESIYVFRGDTIVTARVSKCP